MHQECVILLHGFGCTSFVFRNIENHLRSSNFDTLALNYPSRNFRIIDLIRDYILPSIASASAKYDKIHLVGHSMGGIISRYIMAFHRPENVGKVILIAAPNSGSEVVKLYSKFKWFESLFGPALGDLAIDTPFLKSLPQEVNYEVGVISGNSTINPFHSLFVLQGEDDGTVSVESTKISGMKDHIVISATHTMLLYNKKVAEQTEYFIRNGIFAK